MIIVAQILVGSAALQAADLRGVVRVIDGDTVDVGDTRVRLHGIDAPESGQQCTAPGGVDWSCGDWVTEQVQDLYEGREARCDAVDTDRYGRVVARCFVGQTDVAERLVRDGLAYAYRRYSHRYVVAEGAARAAGLGLHGSITTSPAEYRQARSQNQAAPDAGCAIKGNINARGIRIYHLPGQAYYAQTNVRTDRGERWFCSAAEARASGWRASRR